MSNLPPDSATMIALSDGALAWGVNDHLVALAVDALNAANWQRANGKGPRPKRLPRPGMKSDEGDRFGGRKTYSADQMNQILAANRDTD